MVYYGLLCGMFFGHLYATTSLEESCHCLSLSDMLGGN